MATPVGHSVFGLVFARLAGFSSRAPTWRWVVFSIIAANAPDLDFIPGILVGDINKYHQGPSHSLIAALVFASVAAFANRLFHASWLSMSVWAFVMYSSHLILDYFLKDLRAPFGIPLFWPFLSDHFTSPWPVFRGILHGVPGDTTVEFLRSLVSWHNLETIVIEVMVLAPVLLVVIYVTKLVKNSSALEQSAGKYD